MATATDARASRWLWIWAACYLVLIGAIVWSLLYAKRHTLAEFSQGASVQHWQAWREDVQRHDKRLGPTTRRVPKSAEPPALVLMRDYFGVCLGGAILLTTVLYWIIAWFAMGAIAAESAADSNNQTRRRRR